MKTSYRDLLFAAVLAIVLGAIAIIPTVNSENGYVAGYVFVPILFLICCCSFVVFVAGLITVTKRAGPILLTFALLLPCGYFAGAFVSKALELGAYREQPMVPTTADPK